MKTGRTQKTAVHKKNGKSQKNGRQINCRRFRGITYQLNIYRIFTKNEVMTSRMPSKNVLMLSIMISS